MDELSRNIQSLSGILRDEIDKRKLWRVIWSLVRRMKRLMMSTSAKDILGLLPRDFQVPLLKLIGFNTRTSQTIYLYTDSTLNFSTDLWHGVYFPDWQVGDIVKVDIYGRTYEHHVLHPDRFVPLLPYYEPIGMAYMTRIDVTLYRDSERLPVPFYALGSFLDIRVAHKLKSHYGRFMTGGLARIGYGDADLLPSLATKREGELVKQALWEGGLARREARYRLQMWATRISYLLGGCEWERCERGFTEGV